MVLSLVVARARALGLGSLLALSFVAAGCGSNNAGEGVGACDSTPTVSDADFCSAMTCGGSTSRGTCPVCACDVWMKPPSDVLERTTNTKEFAGQGAPELTCFQKGSYPQAGTSKTVTMTGAVKIFANGCSSDGVTIEVWTVNPDGSPGQIVGTPVTTPTADGSQMNNDVSTCPNGRTEYKFTYAGVPTYQDLLIKTYAKDGISWSTMYDYNQYVSEDDPDFDAGTQTYRHDVRAVASSDYQAIPQAALGRTITSGHGAVAGEIHDCGNVRLTNAAVDVSVNRGALAYFTDNEDNPLPDLTRTQIGSTSSLGLYAALDVVPGPFTVAATGLVDDGAGGKKLVSLGYYHAQVFADAITAVTLRGLRPYQVP